MLAQLLQIQTSSSLTLYWILLSLGCYCAYLIGFRKSALSQPVTSRNLALVIGVWIVSTGMLASQGFFNHWEGFPPRIGIILLFNIAIVVFAAQSESIRTVLRHTPGAFLIGFQAFRVPVELLLHALYTDGQLPVHLTYSGYNFDILTGLTALPAAWWTYRGGKVRRTFGLLWNIGGITLLLIIVGMALLTFPTPLQQFDTYPDNTIIATFPVIWLPAVLVMFAALFHVFSIRKLLRGGDQTSTV